MERQPHAEWLLLRPDTLHFDFMAACYQDQLEASCSAGVCLLTGSDYVFLGVVGLSTAALVLCMFLWMVYFTTRRLKYTLSPF